MSKFSIIHLGLSCVIVAAAVVVHVTSGANDMGVSLIASLGVR
ncbi:hypothetical protein ACS3SW_12075 [Roseobacteraceae bacterium S113]